MTTWSDVKYVDPDGWFGSENQGADIAVQDISGSGRPDLVVFHSDLRDGENRGFYRIGWDLDAEGNVTGGWTGVMEIPHGLGERNQGVGITLSRIAERPRPDLIVFHLVDLEGENTGFYRIGWDIRRDGTIAEDKWSEIHQVPGWFGADNQGAAIAAADVNRTGNRSLIVCHMNNPHGENRAFYRVGYNLDFTGNASAGWTDPIAIDEPNWFGSQTQGLGVAAGRFRDPEELDLVVFHIDDRNDRTSGENTGHFRIGRNMQLDGKVTEWSGIGHVPGWFGANDQGAGIATTTSLSPGRADLIVFHLDNPDDPGNTENAGYYRVGYGFC